MACSHVRVWRRLWAGLLLGLVSLVVHASGTVPSTSTVWGVQFATPQTFAAGTCTQVYQFQHASAQDDGPCIALRAKMVQNGMSVANIFDIPGSCRFSWGCGNTSTNTPNIPLTAVQVPACPANSTLTGGACVCTDPYVSDGSQCVAANCTALEKVSEGFYPISSQNASPQFGVCSGACSVSFEGISPAGSNTTGGVKQWYAKGHYFKTGEACPGGSTAPPGATPSVPPDTCGPGQVGGTVNGVLTCVAGGSGGTGGTTGGGGPGGTTTTRSTETQNPNGSTTNTTEKTTTTPGGSTSRETTTTTSGGGGPTVVVTSSSGAAPGGNNETDGSACKENPNAKGCGGNPGAVTGQWGAKGKTVSGVLTAAKNAFTSSPAGSAVSNFFTVADTGSCPTWTWNIPFINSTHQVDAFCAPWALAAYAALRVCILVVFSFFAFRVAVE